MGKAVNLNDDEKSLIFACLEKYTNETPYYFSKVEVIKQELNLKFGSNYLKVSLRALICGSIRQYVIYPNEEFIYKNYTNNNRTNSDIEKIKEINFAINILEKMKLTKKIEEIKIPI